MAVVRHNPSSPEPTTGENSMKHETAELLANASLHRSTGEIHVFEDYSGRGMFGKRTTAVTYPSMKSLMVAIAAAAIAIGDDQDEQAGFLADLEHLQTDSMGQGYVAY